MKSFKKLSPSSMLITDEDGVEKEWTREFEAKNDKKNGKYDFDKKMKIKGYWYVTTKSDESEEEED